jgi:membrane protein YqaA with SNARE-associated domain
LLALAAVSKGLWTWVLRLGGPGLVVVGLIDNSVIPIPGGMDFFVIVLTARDRDLWLYYAFMAVAGAVVGGYITYYLAEKGGKIVPRRFTTNSKIRDSSL